MSADSYGIDPETMDPTQMPPDFPGELLQEPSVDPNSPPADPMLQQEPDQPDPYEVAEQLGENATRDRVQLCVLLAIETAAKAVEAGVGAENPEYATRYGQAAASLGQAYASLSQIELGEQNTQIKAGDSLAKAAAAARPSEPSST